MNPLCDLPLDTQMILIDKLASVCKISFVMMSYANKFYYKHVTTYAIKYNLGILSGFCIPRRVDCSSIVINGYLNILKWAHSNGYQLNPHMYTSAAENGHIEILEWIKSIDGDGWKVFLSTTSKVVARGYQHLESSLVCTVCSKVAARGYLDVFKWILSNCDELSLCKLRDDLQICNAMASCGYLEMLKYADINGFHYNNLWAPLAAYNGHLEIIKWCMYRRLPMLRSMWYNAANYGHLHILEWGYKNGLITNSDTYILECAVNKKQRHILLWAREKGFVWDSETEFWAKKKWPSMFI